MESQIPIKVELTAKKPKSMLRGCLITIIVLLVLLNVAMVFVWWQGKKFVNDFATSARRATRLAKTWGVSADVGLPTIDVAGADIPFIGRFPGSIRTYYAKKDKTTTVEYKTTEIPKIILNYFRSKLAQNGWVLLSSSDDGITFTQDGQQVSVILDPTKQGLQVATIGMIFKTK